MPFQAEPVVLSKRERLELEQISGSQSLPAGFVVRAKILLLSSEGWSHAAIAGKLDIATRTVWRWKKRFLDRGLDGLETQRPGQAPPKLTPKLRARILNATRRKPRPSAGSAMRKFPLGQSTRKGRLGNTPADTPEETFVAFNLDGLKTHRIGQPQPKLTARPSACIFNAAWCELLNRSTC